MGTTASSSSARIQALAVLGVGKMGGALARSWAETGAVEPAALRLYDVHLPAAQAVARDTGAPVASSPTEAVRGADVLLISVKPHSVAQSLRAVHDAIEPSCLVLSIAPGIRLAVLEAGLPPGTRVVRVMPNTPALVKEGAAAFCRGQHATREDADRVEALFGAVGTVVEVEERQLDAVTGLSGSGPAYLYLIIEALADGGVQAGLPRDVARTLAAQTALGAAKMVLQTGEHTAVLKDAVTTPGGTTIAGLAVLERAGLRGILMEAVQAATNRARELG